MEFFIRYKYWVIGGLVALALIWYFSANGEETEE
jgi:uncharacterized membrane protein